MLDDFLTCPRCKRFVPRSDVILVERAVESHNFEWMGICPHCSIERAQRIPPVTEEEGERGYCICFMHPQGRDPECKICRWTKEETGDAAG